MALISWITSIMVWRSPFVESSLSFTARQLGLRRVEVRRPEAADAVEPGVDVAQPGWIDRVEAAGSLGAGGREASFAQHPQVGGDARLGDAELALDDAAHRAGGQLAVSEEFEDAAADGIAEDVEGVHLAAMISVFTYINKGLDDVHRRGSTLIG